MDLLPVSRPVVIPAGFDESCISFRIVVMNVDVFLMISAAVYFDRTTVRAPWTVLCAEVLDRIVGHFLVPDVQVYAHWSPAAFRCSPKCIAWAVQIILRDKGVLASGHDALSRIDEFVVSDDAMICAPGDAEGSQPRHDDRP